VKVVYRIDVDRVTVHGAALDRLRAADVQVLAESAVARQLAHAVLPAGRTMRSAVAVDAPSLARGGSSAIASAIASGVVRAVAGGGRRG